MENTQEEKKEKQKETGQGTDRKRSKYLNIGMLRLEKSYILYICLIGIGVFLITAGIRDIVSDYREAAAARDEYDYLYDLFARSTPGDNQTTVSPTPGTGEQGNLPPEDPGTTDGFPSLDELAAMNSDFIGWFSIEGFVEYPVVQTTDNVKYINTTFMGEKNTAGALFMDYRHTNVWDEKVCIIYGHRTYDGTMFAPLESYFDATFMRRNSIINITTRNGEVLTYKIFAAKATDAWDTSYSVALTNTARAHEVFPNAPENANYFLILSTCTRSPNPDERTLVFAALVE